MVILRTSYLVFLRTCGLFNDATGNSEHIVQIAGIWRSMREKKIGSRPAQTQDTAVLLFWRVAGESFRARVLKFPINFEEIFSRAHGNFEDQNKVLEPSTIIVNYCIDCNNIIIIQLMHTTIITLLIQAS